jgi:hypothetical protein
MKKYLLIAISFIFLCTINNAQSLRFGVVASPSISWFKTDLSRISGDGNKVGINIGLMADRYFADHYAFSTGLTIHSIGGIIKYSDNEPKTLKTSDGDKVLPIGSRVKYNLQYLHVPFALKFKTTEIGYSTFYAQLGLDGMVNIKARANVNDMNISSANVADEINFLYMGYHIGAGIEYKIVGNTALVAGLTYMNGFTDVTSETTQKALMHCVEFKIGVIF